MAGLLITNGTQFGDSSTPTHNFTLTAAKDDGTLKLSRGNSGATTQDIMTIAANGEVDFPQMIRSLSGNGYYKFPGGLIIQWIKGAASTAEGNQTVTFPVSFPSSCFFAGVFTQANTSDRFFQTMSWTNTNCVIFDNMVNTSTGTIYPIVFAVGY